MFATFSVSPSSKKYQFLTGYGKSYVGGILKYVSETFDSVQGFCANYLDLSSYSRYTFACKVSDSARFIFTFCVLTTWPKLPFCSFRQKPFAFGTIP